jgi:type IV secretory pathway ATPase VirB11/archaellum biosynthesis ATPase
MSKKLYGSVNKASGARATPDDNLTKKGYEKNAIVLKQGNWMEFVERHRARIGREFGTLDEVLSGTLPSELSSIKGIMKNFPAQDGSSTFARAFPRLTAESTGVDIGIVQRSIFGVGECLI